eukprot:521687_1
MSTSLCLLFLPFLYSVLLSHSYEYHHQNLYYHPLKIKDILLTNCTENYYEQPLDHFNYNTGSTPNNIQTYKQRYFICGGSKWVQNNTIFFYLGNEANVELYVNHTGLMWENEDAFQAIMIFAEHRYYGNSKPFTATQLTNDVSLYRFVNPDQALADYAQLIYYLKSTKLNSLTSPIIGFGGSYGGMLCAWFSIKYPQWLDGCISGSAPILDFEALHPPINPKFYAQTMTFDASTAGGGNDICSDNIRNSWVKLFSLISTGEGRKQLSNIFKLCTTLKNERIANATAFWAADAMSTLAMGSYPYPSSYLTNGIADLPAYPLRYACNKYMIKNFSMNNNDILYALSDFIGVLYNVTNDTNCYDINDNLMPYMPDYVDANAWMFMSCSVIFMTGTFNDLYTSDGINDMFWDYKWDIQRLSDSCYNSLGIRPRVNWTQINYGGNILQNDGVKNIVFSNGLLDPWSNGGVKFNNTANGIYSISTGMVGHHMDLMFSTSKDPASVINARKFEVQQMTQWVKQ